MTKEDLQAIATLLDEKIKPIQEDIGSIKADISDLKDGQEKLEQGQTKLELKMENEVDRAIKTIGEGHLDLNQKLIEKISLDNRVELLEHKVSALEYVVKK